MTITGTPEIITISKTKLQDQNIYNISIQGYEFLSLNSPTSAGDVSNKLNFTRRRDLELQELMVDGVLFWIKLRRDKHKNMNIGCVYRHPHYNCLEFHNALKTQLHNLNTRDKEVFVLGDININLLQCNSDNQTSEYLDMVFDLGYMPLITKPTQITNHSLR